MATSLGLAGTGTAPAAALEHHVKPGSQWTVEVDTPTAFCEIATFDSNGSFTTDSGGDSGSWTGGGKKLGMHWSQGRDSGEDFLYGTYYSGIHTYVGVFEYEHDGVGYYTEVVEGVVAGC
ncbi:MAG TPA: hypothetical protein VEJ87_17005 [Acidimicrobiales bacterium]|nr:hypothetical protein [Acidimicrobiales bacterium]